MVYDYKLTFNELSQKDRPFTIHRYNIQTLCTELHKVYHNLSQTIFRNLFAWNSNSYYFRSKFHFQISQVRTVLKGSNSIRYYGPIIWSLVPGEIRYTYSLEKLTSNIRKWNPNDCPTEFVKITWLDFWKYLNSISTFSMLHLVVLDSI